MTTQQLLAATEQAPDRDRRAWVAPLIATILLVVLGPLAILFGGLSGMATDACGPDNCPPALMTSLDVIYGILDYGLLVTLPAYAASWALPWQLRWLPLRAGLAFVSVLPALTILVLVFTLPSA
jgi:hypothetical protein